MAPWKKGREISKGSETLWQNHIGQGLARGRIHAIHFASGKTGAHRGEENLETVQSEDKQNTAALNNKTKQPPKRPRLEHRTELKAGGPH